MVLFIVFGGYYVNPDNVPIYFKRLNKCSLIKWAFQGLKANEFQGLQFEAFVRLTKRRAKTSSPVSLSKTPPR